MGTTSVEAVLARPALKRKILTTFSISCNLNHVSICMVERLHLPGQEPFDACDSCGLAEEECYLYFRAGGRIGELLQYSKQAKSYCGAAGLSHAISCLESRVKKAELNGWSVFEPFDFDLANMQFDFESTPLGVPSFESIEFAYDLLDQMEQCSDAKFLSLFEKYFETIPRDLGKTVQPTFLKFLQNSDEINQERSRLDSISETIAWLQKHCISFQSDKERIQAEFAGVERMMADYRAKKYC